MYSFILLPLTSFGQLGIKDYFSGDFGRPDVQDGS